MSRLRKRHCRPTRTAGNFAGLDQAVDRPEVDLEVLEYLFGREKAFVRHIERTLPDNSDLVRWKRKFRKSEFQVAGG